MPPPGGAPDSAGKVVLTLPVNGATHSHHAGVWRFVGAKAVPADTAPAPAFGATWLTAGDALYRVGGSRCPDGVITNLCHGARMAWRHVGGTWAAAADADTATTQLFDPHAIADVDHARLLAWTGKVGAVVDLIKFTAKPMTTKLRTSLPALAIGARTATDHPAARTWQYGISDKAGPTKGSAELWVVELGPAPVSKLLWSGPAKSAPPPTADATMTRDAVLNRLVLIVPGASLQVWAMSLQQPKKWELIGTDVGVVGGRVRLLGDAGIPTPLVLIGHKPNGPPAALRRLSLGAKAVFSAHPDQPAQLWAPFEAAWRRNPGRATITRGIDAGGRLLSGLSDLPWACK